VGIVDEPIFKGYVPFPIMDEVEEDFASKHGLTPGRFCALRFYWLTKELIIVIEFPKDDGNKRHGAYLPSVRSVLRLNKWGHIDNLGLEGLMEPEAQDALKSWTVLAQMAPKKNATET